jgi:hypothetical protein
MRLNNTYSLLLLIALITCATYLTTQLIAKHGEPANEVISNINYMNSASFHISADSTQLKTSASGTVFVQGEKRKVDHVSIVAAVDVDPDDWGGVAFYIPDHWKVSNVLSSYSENNEQTISSDHVTTWTTASTNSEWKAWIEIGRDRTYKPTGGGSGTVVIDLVYDNAGEPMPDSIEFAIEVGGRTIDGHHETGTDHIRVPVALNAASEQH